MVGADRWEDGTGRVRWQPRVGDKLAWKDGLILYDFATVSFLPPVLFRSRRRAERFARKEERRRARDFRRAG